MPHLGDLYYEELGAGPALLLLHGHTLDRRIWAEHLEALAASYRVITPDLAGHGLSGIAADATPYCCALLALLDHLGIERAIVAGLSLGGAVAVSFALHHPERCSALIPIDAALFGHPFKEWPGPRPYVKQARSVGLAAALEGWLTDSLFAHALASPAGEQIRAIVREYPGSEWLGGRVLACPPGPPEAERLGEITTPTLVMVGEHDLADFQQIADRLASEIPHARKAMIPGAGHLAPCEAPAAFREQLSAFLTTLSQP